MTWTIFLIGSTKELSHGSLDIIVRLVAAGDERIIRCCPTVLEIWL
jgi:hypothetical protein